LILSAYQEKHTMKNFMFKNQKYSMAD